MDQQQLDIFVGEHRAGFLGRSELQARSYVYGYFPESGDEDAVSLTMPVMADQYVFQQGVHPIFQMNLPEGELREMLRNTFQKTVQNFDDLSLLSIVGHSQIGRVRIAQHGEQPAIMPQQSVKELKAYQGSEDLFADLMQRFGRYSGISGVQPKVLVRDSEAVAQSVDAAELEQVTYRDSTHIVKAWNPERFPQLAANEYFCMLAAERAGLAVAEVELAAQGRLLIVKRFDLDDKGGYLGFEDFCVLNGLATDDKYVGSYQDIAERIRQFVSPHLVHDALEQFFLSLALTVGVRNGDGHLKNFGVLYTHPEAEVRFAPAFDIISTMPYVPNDSLALLFGGSKFFPHRKGLVTFGRRFCGLTEKRVNHLLDWVVHGMESALLDLQAYQKKNKAFAEVGELMQKSWREGIDDLQGHN